MGESKYVKERRNGRKYEKWRSGEKKEERKGGRNYEKIYEWKLKK
jgi:hypothetical protein